MADLETLYRQVIMDHYKNPRNKGLVEDDSYRKFHIKNPSCGDDVTIQLKVEGDKITDARQDGTGCSICCSSASVMTQTLKNQTVEHASEIITNYFDMIKGHFYDEEMDMGEAIVFQGVAQFPARTKCATVAWLAAEEALKDE